MTRLMRGCPTARSQKEGVEVPERDPQQEDQPDATEGRDMEEYNLDVVHEESEPRVKQSAPEQRDIHPDAEHANMEIP